MLAPIPNPNNLPSMIMNDEKREMYSDTLKMYSDTLMTLIMASDMVLLPSMIDMEIEKREKNSDTLILLLLLMTMTMTMTMTMHHIPQQNIGNWSYKGHTAKKSI